jgi:FkbM family methyltransferase
MTQNCKRFIKKIFSLLGLSVTHVPKRGIQKEAIVSPDAYLGEGSLRGMLERLRRKESSFQTVIDVGAAYGGWSRQFADALPRRRHLLVEANSFHAQALEKCCRANPGWEYVLKACGSGPGKIFFDGTDPMGGLASQSRSEDSMVEVEMTSIDYEVNRLGLPGPFLIKLDTHGFEVPILEGATGTLENAEYIVVESYNFTMCEGALRFWELCAWMEARGFAPLDLYDLCYRAYDLSFWHMDIVFARKANAAFRYTKYR